MSRSVNLYLQTEYSLLTSLIRIKELPDLLKEAGYDACAVCDDEMYGTIKFYNICIENKIKPIIGYRLKVMSYVFLLYAKDNVGLCNLYKICTKNHLPGINDISEIKELTQNLLCVYPYTENRCNEFSFSRLESMFSLYQSIFPELYIGISRDMTNDKSGLKDTIDFFARRNILPVALNRTCYVKEEDAEIYQILREISISDNNLHLQEEEKHLCFLSDDDVSGIYREFPSLLENTIKIKDACKISFVFNQYKMPAYPLPDSFKYLSDLCKVGLNKRIALKEKNVDANKYKERLVYELDIIKQMGYGDYFLIVFDYVKWAKNQGIMVGPGRGSAGGSLVGYSLGITDIDPLEYDLLFERFLNPERVSMPDIDVDFQDNRRDEVIGYIGERYGKNRVAHITTFGTFQARLALRDVARMQEVKDFKLREVLKYVPVGKSNLKRIVGEEKYLQDLIESDIEIRNLLHTAMRIEGLPRNCSTHAAGILIADRDLVTYTPLQEGIGGLYQTQFEASDLEKLGLLKMDVLGLKNLTVIKDVLTDIKRFTGEDLKLANIPLNDGDVMHLLQKGKTLGIFQLESAGVTKLLTDLKCSSFMDIVNATSLYRPGPMDMIPMFVERKFRQEYTLIDSSLASVLKSTNGIIVFQEQIMQIAGIVAGYSLGDADILRRAISKKQLWQMQNERKKFIEKALRKGYSFQKANEIFDYIEKFASYGFNKSHAVAYSLVAYQMAYLKAHYFKYFVCALMSANIGNSESLLKYIREARREKIQVLPPDINKSENKFIVTHDGILFPLSGVNTIGDICGSKIADARKEGIFSTYDDFIDRTKDILSKRQVLSLIASGAFDSFSHPRKALVLAYDSTLEKSNYKMLSGITGKTIISDEEYDFTEISTLEYEALGFNLKYSRFKKYEKLKEKYRCVDFADALGNKTNLTVACINNIKTITTKTNQQMAFVEMFDDSLNVSGVIFNNVYLKFKDSLRINSTYLVSYRYETRKGRKQAVIDALYRIG